VQSALRKGLLRTSSSYQTFYLSFRATSTRLRCVSNLFMTCGTINFSTDMSVSASCKAWPQLEVPDRSGSPRAVSSPSLQFPSSVVLQTDETTSCRASVPTAESLRAWRTATHASQEPRFHIQDLYRLDPITATHIIHCISTARYLPRTIYAVAQAECYQRKREVQHTIDKKLRKHSSQKII